MTSLDTSHGHYYPWQTELVGLHLASDLMIAISYFSMSIALFHFAQKQVNSSLNWMFQLFTAFTILCGTTHLLGIWMLWHSDYWLSGITEAITAAVSACTAVVLVTLMPQALTLPSPAQLKTSNQAFQQQIHNRELAESQTQQLNKELEILVNNRTQELAASMLQARDLAERMALATDAARIGTYDWNLVTQKITWNDYYATLLGYSSETAAADSHQAWERHVAPEELPRVKAALELARDTQTDYAEEYRIVWDDGSSHWIEEFGRFYYDNDSQAVRMAGIINDITERIQAESNSRESEEQFRATFEQAAVGIAHVSLTGQWLRVNQKFCAIIGYTEAELLNSTFQDITHPEDISADLEYVHQLLAGNIQTYEMEKRYIHKSGQIVWVNLTVSTRRDVLNAPIHFISVVEKIDDRKRVEFALKEQAIKLARTATLVERRNQDLDQFAHIVSHDLKAPLRAIANLSTWIEEDLEEGISPETREQLNLMRSRVYRMEGLINGLLDYARAGSTQASWSTFAIEDLLAEIIDSLGLPTGFIIKLPTNLPAINTDYLLLSQVFANLLSNACKHHNRSDGQILVTAKLQGDTWVFTVVDDGPGIAPENQGRVFDIFQTLADDNTQENTGIGLSIVKKIVESQGGEITLESEIGMGTTFKFTWIINSGQDNV